MTDRESPRQRRRRRVRELLLAWDRPALVAALEGEPGLLAACVALLVEVDDRLRWRAVHALGLLAGQRARSDLDAVRELVRRQLWSMNDESGNVAWHAAEAVGEILYQVPPLRPTFAPNLFAHREDAIFRPGIFWAMARLAEVAPEVVVEEWPAVMAALGDQDPQVRGLAALVAARCHARVGDLEARRALRRRLDELLEDTSPVELFDPDRGELEPFTVARLASEALASLGSAPEARSLKPEA